MSTSRWPLRRGVALPSKGDIALTVVLTAATAFWGDLLATSPTRQFAAVLTSLGLTLPLLVRQRRPLIMLAIVSVAGLVQCVAVPGPTASLLAVPVVAYSIARWIDGGSSRLVLVSGTIGAVLGPLRWVHNPGFTGEDTSRVGLFVLLFIMCFTAVLVPYLIGRRLRENDIAAQELARAAVQRYEATLTNRAERARSTEARVRNDIARELHDVVAHSLSVIVVQAEGGKAMAARNPQGTGEVLDIIAETGREALTEMRRIVGVLRAGPGQADYAPQPGLEDIPGMVERAGDRVELVTDGEVPVVPATVGLTAYRVVQEAVTNFLKHAGPQARCLVAIDYEPSLITLVIRDDGWGAQASDDGAGNGLRGMRERVSAMGGTITVGPLSSGGFQVQAQLPLASHHPAHPNRPAVPTPSTRMEHTEPTSAEHTGPTGLPGTRRGDAGLPGESAQTASTPPSPMAPDHDENEGGMDD
ncbi:Signal transduction histidine kinase [Propionibacterium cyclohexanicum]|uniref:histidine kinase n=1 Tax=Propionibacterium cyclohexanicum TaxID=64702 RepID=A0A1H9THF9_9ACTN|nr:sensor histidine kinase [Propionibacterium cyclohexanicum]SER96632.1 Signal transduction histidine kinase [Propionibacterium cyclohexanicum]